MIGKKLLHYEIKSLIGKGGMGNVYLGEHSSIGRKVAIKSLLPELANNSEIRERFKNEASVMARLQHPGIVMLFDYVENEDGLFLIMEFVEGEEITDLLKNLKEPLPIDRAKTIMIKVLEAFDYAHENGIVHRDVKPSNILITPSNEVKVLDFGIAKLVGDAQFNLTKTGTQVGTVYYMSPEQVKAKELDHRSDIYSLGVTFYEMLSGFCPYKGTTSEYEVCDKIVREPLLPLTNAMGGEYSEVWKVIEKATQKKVDDRFQSCQDFIAALEKGVVPNSTKSKPVVKEKTPTIIKDPIQPATNEPNKKSKNWIYFLILGIIVSLVIIFIITRPQDDNSNDYQENFEEYESDDVDDYEYADTLAATEEEYAPVQWMSSRGVQEIMQNYYRGMETDNFNAYNYFANDIDQWISRKNITPGKVNELRASNTEYLNDNVTMTSSPEFVSIKNSSSFWKFWVDFECYRSSKNQIQQCDILIEVGFNRNEELTSYRELKVANLTFEDSY